MCVAILERGYDTANLRETGRMEGNRENNGKKEKQVIEEREGQENR